MTGVTLRPARPGDAAGIARVHVETWRATYAGLVPATYLVGMSEAGQTLFWQKLIARRGKDSLLVAEAGAGGPLVGFGNCGPSRDRAMGAAGEVYTLYVALDWQGRGIGRRLLKGLFETFVGAGIGDAFLWVLADNPARFFYEAVGGQRSAERREPFAGSLLDEAAYVWPDLERWLAEN